MVWMVISQQNTEYWIGTYGLILDVRKGFMDRKLMLSMDMKVIEKAKHICQETPDKSSKKGSNVILNHYKRGSRRI